MYQILIADDDEKTRIRLAKYLTKEFQVSISTAANRAEALEKIEKNRADLFLVITDMRMPDVNDGNAVANRAIKEGIPVIVITGTPKDVQEEIRGKCIEVLHKPSDLEKIIELIESLIAQ